jgi:sugar phosphate isomerase/epimerase
MAAGTAFATIKAAFAAQTHERMKSRLGLVIYTLSLRRKAMLRETTKRDLFEPFTYLDYCHALGAGGVQLPLGVRDDDDSRKLRERAEQYGMYVEGIIRMPENDRDLERFEAEVRTAGETGALALRTTLLPGRRYEQFARREEYLAAAEQSRQWVLRAAPIVERHRVRLAIENHKDRRADELVSLLRSVGSEYVGACVDFGNNFALLEDPVAVVEALAPWAYSVHIKDQAVQEYEEGFLFADVPLGKGFLDLKRMVDILLGAKPDVRFSLEVITRDPLKVPVLAEKYWVTFPDVPGSDLARTLRTVRRHAATDLSEISSLPLEKQVEAESATVCQSLDYARSELEL